MDLPLHSSSGSDQQVSGKKHLEMVMTFLSMTCFLTSLFPAFLVARLYKAGSLVHGDLSEYNILVAPAGNVENRASGVEDPEELQVVLIDFGQAVLKGHPSAVELLKRDLDNVLSFFSRKGVRTMSKDEALAILLGVT